MTRKKKKAQPIIPSGEKILTFDVASASGYAFGAGGRLVSYGKYASDKNDELGMNLLKFSKWISKVVNDLPDKPDRVIIEQPFFRRNLLTFAILSKYVAIVQREVARILGMECEFISPNTVKSVLKLPSGKSHNQHKQNMIVRINKLFGTSLKFSKSRSAKVKHSDDDAADAIGILAAVWIKEGVLEDV